MQKKKSDLMFHLYLRGFVLGFSLKKFSGGGREGVGSVKNKIIRETCHRFASNSFI